MIPPDPQPRGARRRRFADRDHDRRNDIAHRDRPGPAVVFEAVDRVTFDNHIALRRAIAAVFVDAANAPVDRAVGRFLQRRVERGPDREAALV